MFVAREFNDDKTGDVIGFAPTPSLEAFKLLISDAATIEKGKDKKCIMINDVVRAYFEAPVKRDICIELPQEDLEEGESNENLVGLLEMSLHGTRNAASNFQDEAKAFMTMLGFSVGRHNALHVSIRREI